MPDSNTRRFPDAGGTYRTLGLNPNIDSAALKRAVMATTDSNGEFTFELPYSASAAHPATPSAVWTIILPSGDQWYGAVPSVAGPLTIDDLVQTYSWVSSSAAYIAPVTPGTLAVGTATFSVAVTATIVFSAVFASSAYRIKLTPSVDSVTGNVPVVAFEDKTTTGFVIRSSGSFSGTVDWEAAL